MREGQPSASERDVCLKTYDAEELVVLNELEDDVEAAVVLQGEGEKSQLEVRRRKEANAENSPSRSRTNKVRLDLVETNIVGRRANSSDLEDEGIARKRAGEGDGVA